MRKSLVAVGALVVACGVAPKSEDVTSEDATDVALTFPPGFLWGVATSPYESEGRDSNTDWEAFVEAGNAPAAGWAQNTWDLYDTDAANAESLHLGLFQLGIEWGRLVPKQPADATAPLQPGDIDPAAVAHYHAVLASLAKHHLTPMVAVTHFALPRWITDGWTDPITGPAMASYAEFLAREFGDEVKLWITEDEPTVALLAGYMDGSFPPGYSEMDLENASLPHGASPKTVLHNMIAGHALAYHAIKAVRPDSKVTFAHNSVWWEPNGDEQHDIDATKRVDYAYNLLFLDAVTAGKFDTSLIGDGPFEPHPEWQNTLDFIGVNYYDAAYVVGQWGILPPLNALPCSSAVLDSQPFVSWLVGCSGDHPPEEPAMAKMLMKYEQRYHLPQLVTESGFIDTPKGKSKRLVKILNALHSAIDQGATVLGYTYWTLNHDYEWNDGWTQDMGLFDIAGISGKKLPASGPGANTDFTRIPLHPFVDVYGQIAGQNQISADLLAKYGH
jgi:beta-glucosidase